MNQNKPRKLNGYQIRKTVEEKVLSGHYYPTSLGLALAKAVDKTFNPKPSTRYKGE